MGGGGEVEQDEVVGGVEVVFAGFVDDAQLAGFVGRGGQDKVCFAQFQVGVGGAMDAQGKLGDCVGVAHIFLAVPA